MKGKKKKHRIKVKQDTPLPFLAIAITSFVCYLWYHINVELSIETREKVVTSPKAQP